MVYGSSKCVTDVLLFQGSESVLEAAAAQFGAVDHVAVRGGRGILVSCNLSLCRTVYSDSVHVVFSHGRGLIIFLADVIRRRDILFYKQYIVRKIMIPVGCEQEKHKEHDAA